MNTSKDGETGTDANGARATRVLTYYFLSAAAEGLMVVLLFVSIPADPKNIYLLGYSKTRLCFIVLFLLLTLTSILGTIRLRRNTKWQAKITNKINSWVVEYRWFIPIMILLFWIVILGPYGYLLLKGPIQGSLYRIYPLILFSLTRTVQTLIVYLSVVYTGDKLKTAAAQNGPTILLDPRKITVLLAVFAVLLILASLSGELMNQILPWDQRIIRYLKKFDLDCEQNIPTYFSSFILLFSAFLLGVIAGIKQKARGLYSYHWTFLAFIFLFMSLDESVVLHEFLIKPLRSVFTSSGVLYFSWVILAIPIVIMIAAAYFKFLLHLPVKSRNQFLIAAVIYIVGVLVLEMVGGWYYESYGSDTLLYIFMTSVEEILEIAGILVFIHALLGYIKVHFPEIRFSLSDPG